MHDTDDYDPSAAIKTGVAAISAALADGASVLCHCQKGVSRSVCIVLAFLVACRGMSLLDALRLVRERRPVAYPRHAFLEALIALEVAYRPGTPPSLPADVVRALHRDPRPSLQPAQRLPSPAEPSLAGGGHASWGQ